ncbi:MAG: patatin-like phospholipase family protein [Proteobacteria bacterium]|jgi:NTE family protein|nr:patatin-like phospholipase family protein [Pseudomonadota bacterium]
MNLWFRSALCALLAATTVAWSAAANARPKVCLVLSGGGARGAAHVGVIKVLEALRVPIDCIVGTSMGSLVGGAYASGMTVPEMTSLLETITTDFLFNESPPRKDQSIHRKIDDRSILFGLELGLSDRGEVLVQKGLVSGVQLETVLRRLALAGGYRNFDQLPIPFRAVATDLVTGKPVVFASGELAQAMRASMSVPGVVAPAEIDGRLLVDGGLTDNLPVDVARRMGADVIIAVNLGTPLLRRDQVGSVLGVTAQMVNILTEQNVRESIASLKPTDILIEPELGEFSAADFDHLPKAVPFGEAAAWKVASKLEALSDNAAAYAAWSRHRIAVTPPDTRPIDEIRFRPLQRVNVDVLRGELETKVHAPLDQATLDDDMRRLYGTGDFERLNYRVVEEAGKRVLDVDAVEKAWGPNYLRFGLGLGSDLQGDSFFNLATSYRRTWVNELGAEWRTDAQVGRTSRLATEFYQPLETRDYLFVAPRLEIERRTEDLYEGSEHIARYKLRTSDIGFDVGSDFTKYGEARLGILTGTLHADLDTGPEALAPPGRVRRGALTAQVVFDQLDSLNFPRNGIAASSHLFASTKALGADASYRKWDADVTAATSAGPHTLSVTARVGTALGNDRLPRYDMFQWGGFLQQSGYPTGALVGEQLVFGRAVYAYKLLKAPFIDGLYAGGSLEAGRMERPLVPGSPTGFLKSVSAFLAADTLLGPLYLGYGWAADGNRSAYLYLGRP